MSVARNGRKSIWNAESTLEEDLGAISALGLQQLRDFWKGRWGDPPAYRARDQLLRATAYRLQAEVYGGLAARLNRDLVALGARFADERGFSPGPTIVLKPGSSLVREWGGKRHEVAVVDGGFVYDGERFKSLSSVATRITGTKWNGPVFFGVKPRAPLKAQDRAAST